MTVFEAVTHHRTSHTLHIEQIHTHAEYSDAVSPYIGNQNGETIGKQTHRRKKKTKGIKKNLTFIFTVGSN